MTTVTNEKTVEILALIDCGAGGTFIDQNFARKFNVKNLEQPIRAYNVDGTENKQGMIRSYVDLEFTIDRKKMKDRFHVTRLGKQKIILGFPWLHKHNPTIDWKQGTIQWPKTNMALFAQKKIEQAREKKSVKLQTLISSKTDDFDKKFAEIARKRKKRLEQKKPDNFDRKFAEIARRRQERLQRKALKEKKFSVFETRTSEKKPERSAKAKITAEKLKNQMKTILKHLDGNKLSATIEDHQQTQGTL